MHTLDSLDIPRQDKGEKMKMRISGVRGGITQLILKYESVTQCTTRPLLEVLAFRLV